MNKIASSIIQELEGHEDMALFEIKKEKYYEIEEAISRIILDGLKNWFCFDLDLNKHFDEKVED